MKPPIAKPAAPICQFSQPLSERSVATVLLLVLEDRPVQVRQLTRPTLAEAVPIHRIPPLHVRRQWFFVARSFRAALSSMASASIRFGRLFSSSSALDFLASHRFMPPNLALYL